jgi:pyruvate dehydrogenase E2 component (dihydrolipoamide acetyltransferase)
MQLGKITSWIAAEGDEIAVGDELADIETEKIAGTLGAAEAGTLRRILARVGEDVPKRSMPSSRPSTVARR